ncbi:MAG: PCMD domain-containing protein, partial [Bacteroides sp.]
WVTRKIHESGIIGGATKYLYELGPTQMIEKNEAYKNLGGSPWANSNVMAKVAGIVKTNTSVFPEKRGDGYCVRLETRMESVKVLGIVDITVLAAGSLYTGTVHEPVSGTKNPMKILGMGIPFTQMPKAVRFDYKIKMSGDSDRIRATGFSRISKIPGKDLPAVILLLQKRWEDNKGNLYAIRVGTMVVKFDKSTTGWINKATYPVMYGNITQSASYKPEWMKIQEQERYSLNSKGKSVPIKEVGWATEDDKPTHMVLQFTS